MEENEGTEEDFIGEQLSTLANLLCGSTSMMTTSLHEQPPCEGDNHKNEVNTAFIQQQHEQQPVEVYLYKAGINDRYICCTCLSKQRRTNQLNYYYYIRMCCFPHWMLQQVQQEEQPEYQKVVT